MRSGVIFCVICFFVYGSTSLLNFDESTEVGNNNSNLIKDVRKSYNQLFGTLRDQEMRTVTVQMEKIKDMVLQLLTDPNNSEMECCRTALNKLLDNVANSIAKDTNAQFEAIIEKAKKDADEATKKAAETIKKAQEQIKKAQEEIKKAEELAKNPSNAKNYNPWDNNDMFMDQIYDVYVNIPRQLVNNLTNALNKGGAGRRSENVFQRGTQRSRHTVLNFTSTMSTSYTPTTEESIWHE